MKTQMRFQKIFMIVSLVIAALTVVYALIFCSGSIFQVTKLYDVANKADQTYEVNTGTIFNQNWVTYTAVGAGELFKAAQSVSDLLLILGIVMILVVVLNFIVASQKRRNYYVTNYVATGITVAFEIALAIVIIVVVCNCQHVFNTKCDFEQMKIVYESAYSDKFNTGKTWTFGLGYAVAAILVVDAIGFIFNLVWKILLMQGEKKLLEGGLVREVA